MSTKFYLDVINLYAKKACEMTGADGAALEEIDGDSLVYRAVAGTLSQSQGLRLILKGSYSGDCYATRKPILLNTIDLSERPTAQVIKSLGIESMLLVPVNFGQKTLAVFKVCASTQNRFTEQDIWKLQSLAEMTAGSLAELKVQESEEKLLAKDRFIERVFAVAPCALYVFDMNQRRNVWASQDFESMTGYTPAEIQGFGSQVMQTMCHPEDHPVLEAQFQRMNVLADGEHNMYEFRLRCKDGEWIWVSCRTSVLSRNEDGTCSQYVGVAMRR